MYEICELITQAQAAKEAQQAKQRAFGQIVRRFQDLAFGCAYAILGDFDLAEDAAQEAFLCAWRNLEQLRVPEAFPGWFKRIVLTQCNRMTRGKRLDAVSLETLYDLPSERSDPYQLAAQRAQRESVHAAIRALPEKERIATMLFYINEYSLKEIAAFLEVPVSTVKKRLYCARKTLREGMLPMVQDTLQERRPSNDDRFENVVALYNDALDAFVGKIRNDPYILAAILFGSLSYDQVWKKSDIDMILVGKDEKKGVQDFCLVENGVNIHAILMPRSKFKQMLEGQLQGGLTHSMFEKSTLLFSKDETLREYYLDSHHIGSRDRDLRLLQSIQMTHWALTKAEKWLIVKQDPCYSSMYLFYVLMNLAKVEVVLHGEVPSRESLQQALKHNPDFFQPLYIGLMNQPKDEATVRDAIDRIYAYIEERINLLYRPLLEYLANVGGARTMSEIDAYFAKQVQTETLSGVCEWLSERDILQKVSRPLRLHEKSKFEVQEAAYYYDDFDGRLDSR